MKSPPLFSSRRIPFRTRGTDIIQSRRLPRGVPNGKCVISNQTKSKTSNSPPPMLKGSMLAETFFGRCLNGIKPGLRARRCRGIITMGRLSSGEVRSRLPIPLRIQGMCVLYTVNMYWGIYICLKLWRNSAITLTFECHRFFPFPYPIPSASWVRWGQRTPECQARLPTTLYASDSMHHGSLYYHCVYVYMIKTAVNWRQNGQASPPIRENNANETWQGPRLHPRPM